MAAELRAQLEIEGLRRQYALATDLIGTNEPAAVAQGAAIYERIFTPEVQIQTVGGSVPFAATGPQAWVETVEGALEDYVATQHLIGTQLVTFDAFETNEAGVVSGSATMSSYLQAWHEHNDGHVWVFIGTYEDTVEFVPDIGWQISAMTLREVSSERRPLGDLEAPA